MADTDYSALPATNTIASTDSILVVRAGTPFRYTGALPVITAASNFGFGGTPNTRVGITGASAAVGGAPIMRVTTGTGASTDEALEVGVLDGAYTWLQAVKQGTGYRAFALNPSGGNVGIGTATPLFRLVVSNTGAEGIEFVPGTPSGGNTTQHYNRSAAAYVNNVVDASSHRWHIAGAEKARMDSSGNWLVGVTSGSNHIVSKSVATNAGNLVLAVYGSASGAAVQFYSVGSAGAAAANAAVKVAQDSATGRSLNAGGTINASGSDYAEYLKKALVYLEAAFLKGQVLGIDNDGHLTPRWSEAHSFVIKSYDPSMVGGDSWDQHLGPKPEAPAPIGPEPVLPDVPARISPEPAREQAEAEEDFTRRLAEWLIESRAAAEEIRAANAAAAAYPALRAEWTAAKAAFDAAQAEFEAKLRVWQAAHDDARKLVDRIAFSGQVPVIVEGDYAPGQYLVAYPGEDDAIICRALAWSDVIADTDRVLETRVVGKVWAIRSVQRDPADTSDAPEMVTRAWANVLHR